MDASRSAVSFICVQYGAKVVTTRFTGGPKKDLQRTGVSSVSGTTVTTFAIVSLTFALKTVTDCTRSVSGDHFVGLRTGQPVWVAVRMVAKSRLRPAGDSSQRNSYRRETSLSSFHWISTTESPGNSNNSLSCARRTNSASEAPWEESSTKRSCLLRNVLHRIPKLRLRSIWGILHENHVRLKGQDGHEQIPM